MTDKQFCVLCERELCFRWTDTHGVGVCTTCGLPYKIFHYENSKPIERPPSCALKPEALPMARSYWGETQSKVFPGCYDMGVGINGSTFSGATIEEIKKFDTWVRKHPELNLSNV